MDDRPLIRRVLSGLFDTPRTPTAPPGAAPVGYTLTRRVVAGLLGVPLPGASRPEEPFPMPLPVPAARSQVLVSAGAPTLVDEEPAEDDGRGAPADSGTPDTSLPKPRWYLSAALFVDATCLGLPMWAMLASHQPGSVASPAVAGAAWMLLRACRRRYGVDSLGEPGQAAAVLRDWMVLVGVLAVVRALTGEHSDPVVALASLAPGMVCTAITAAGTQRHLRTARTSRRGSQRALVVGEPALVDHLTDRLSGDPACRYTVVGVVPIGEAPVVGESLVVTRLPSEQPSVRSDGRRVLVAASAERADLILLAPGAHLIGDRLHHLVRGLQDAAVPVAVLAGPADLALRRLDLRREAGVNLVHVKAPMRGVQAILKAVLDRFLAAAALLLLSPLLLVLAALVKGTSSGPVLYRQQRVGRAGEPFTMFKFRSMVTNAEAFRAELAELNLDTDGMLFKVRQDPRITRFGSFLRRYSLDDLPQLFNVLRGDMSLVGPRPPLPEEIAYLDRLEEGAVHRLSVRPGMTGLRQYEDGSERSWEAAVKLDMQYIDGWSIGLDFTILVRTLNMVMRGQGY
ncbi:exopolysaccharide biosynthesis polyprenyl glycosylphosphotransferase [Kitasatospora sp. NPDC059088]|uniref:exopolysaccharide biosynthesis polyprenyl glycosylphosphotransferase n=1 Tax=Kitasatospora sp. NPDC059088 TaxID=3346722 RepID=UPI003674F0EA